MSVEHLPKALTGQMQYISDATSHRLGAKLAQAAAAGSLLMHGWHLGAGSPAAASGSSPAQNTDGSCGEWPDEAVEGAFVASAVDDAYRQTLLLVPSPPPSPFTEVDDDALALLQSLWNVHRLEVEQLVFEACRMVLRDPNVRPSVRKLRAEALIQMGQIFRDAARQGKVARKAVVSSSRR